MADIGIENGEEAAALRGDELRESRQAAHAQALVLDTSSEAYPVAVRQLVAYLDALADELGMPGGALRRLDSPTRADLRDLARLGFRPATEDEVQGLGALSNLSLSVDPLTASRYALGGGNPAGFVEVDGHYASTSDEGGRHITSRAATPTTVKPESSRVVRCRALGRGALRRAIGINRRRRPFERTHPKIRS